MISNQMPIIIYFLLALFYSGVSWGNDKTQEYYGPAEVISGDRLKISGQMIRLQDIKAPHFPATAQHLKQLIGQKNIHCSGKILTKNNELIAKCQAGKIELNEQMVRSGYALAYRRYSKDYIPAEEAAKQKKLGLWANPNFKPDLLIKPAPLLGDDVGRHR